ncbi:hypothetical protein [Flavobacterium ajazii]|uniref:hypothetical protein n=1 Tax=Flavobacterium ajazii TaxID=2692318 RepID=UPI001FE70259|nr:hypothetical protein [Flavobacterium ajazii]
MISLVFIPLFCLYHFHKIEAFKNYEALDFSLPNKEDFEKYKVWDLRKYKIFNFNNQKSKEEQKLKELRLFMHDLVKYYDTINGAKIQFGPKTDYDTFVNVIDIVSEEKIPTWVLFGNNMYIIACARPKKRGFVCGTTEYSLRNSRLMEEESRKIELNVFQKSFLKQQWLILLGYLGIVLINIFTLVKINKNQN